MSPLDVIPLTTAKTYLVVDFPDHDSVITTAIKTAVSWIERYTGYRLYQRDIVLPSKHNGLEVSDFPVSVISVTDDGEISEYTKVNRALSIIIYTAYDDLDVNLSVGYTDVTKIPDELISACYKLLTYLYENRDANDLSIPTDIQGLINQLRRDVGL